MNHRTPHSVLAALASVATIGTLGCTPAEPPFTATTTRLSLGPGGVQLGSGAYQLAVSDHGDWLAFTTLDSLQSEDGNGDFDVYVRNPDDGSVRLMSPTAYGPSSPDGGSLEPSLDATGSRVAYSSIADNLAFFDTNGTNDVFSTSVLAATPEATSLRTDVFPFTTASGSSNRPFVSGNGRFVAYTSTAANLVAGDANAVADAFVRELGGTPSERVSLTSDDTEANGPSHADSISTDGRFVTFTSWATNLVTGDSNAQPDVFLRDRALGTTTLVSRTPTGAPFAGPASGGQVSDDGRYVAFEAHSSVGGPVGVYRRDMVAGDVVRVSVAPDGSPIAEAASPSISRDGRYVAFLGTAQLFVSPIHAYVRDLDAAATVIASVDADGEPIGVAFVGTRQIQLSGDGRVVAFITSTSLVPDDTNDAPDVYARRWRP